jgi:hypothetical protein
MIGVLPLFAPLLKSMLAMTGATMMAKMSAPSRAKVTVQAMGLKSRPSTACSVKMGRYEVMMMPRAKKTGAAPRGGVANLLPGRARVVLLGEMADDVFDHDHRAIDHHAEVQRAERKQVGGNVAQVEADGGEHQREGNGERNDDGAAHIAQETETE